MRTILPVVLPALLLFPASFWGQEIRVLVSNVPGADASYPNVGQGYLVRPTPHVDLNVIWDATSQTFRGGFRTDDEWIHGVKQPPTQYEGDEAIVFLPRSGRSQVLDSDPAFFGPLGADVWILPSTGEESAATFTPYVGFSAYGVPHNGTFTGSGTSGTGRIFWSVQSVENLSNPLFHQFYGYNDTLALRLAPPGYQPSAELPMLVNGHSHLNLLFQAPGMYRITFRVRGTLASNQQEVSSLIPVYFGVETWQIPAEGSTFAEAYPGKSLTEIAPNGQTYLFNYAFGGEAGQAPILPTQDNSDPAKLRLVAVIRTNDASVTWKGEVATSLAEGWNSFGVTVTDSPNQENLPPNTVRKIISVDRGSDPKKFIRLAVTKN